MEQYVLDLFNDSHAILKNQYFAIIGAHISPTRLTILYKIIQFYYFRTIFLFKNMFFYTIYSF